MSPRSAKVSRKTAGAAPKPCLHHRVAELGYIDRAHDAQRRLAKGERQSQCPTCGRWYFPDEMGAEEPT